MRLRAMVATGDLYASTVILPTKRLGGSHQLPSHASVSEGLGNRQAGDSPQKTLSVKQRNAVERQGPRYLTTHFGNHNRGAGIAPRCRNPLRHLLKSGLITERAQKLDQYRRIIFSSFTDDGSSRIRHGVAKQTLQRAPYNLACGSTRYTPEVAMRASAMFMRLSS